MVALFKCEDFEPHLHSRFAMTVGDATTSLELIAVERLPHQAPSRQPFSLLFKGAESTVRPQGIYHLSHATMEHLEIFLVPIGRDESGVRYEAIFN